MNTKHVLCVIVICLQARCFGVNVEPAATDKTSDTVPAEVTKLESDELAAADHDRRVKLDKARISLAKHDRRLRNIDAAIANAEAKRKWIISNRFYYTTQWVRRRCGTCGGSGKIYHRTKQIRTVSKCNRCGGDGTYKTKVKVRKTRNTVEADNYIKAMRTARVGVVEERAKVVLLIESLTEVENVEPANEGADTK